MCTTIVKKQEKKRRNKKLQEILRQKEREKQIFFGVLCLDAFRCVVILGSPLISSFSQWSASINTSLDPSSPPLVPKDCFAYLLFSKCIGDAIEPCIY